MKILIVSGFLGAGKTSFIRTLSKKTNKDFAVMENEYGEIGLDGSVLERDRLKVWELTEGCICCSLKSDFATSILTIANTVNPEYLVVEPTGVGSLSSVISNIKKIEYERIKLLEPITIVDINNIDEYLNTFGDLYIDQIKHASRVILSKAEGRSNKVKEAVAKINDINTNAQITANYIEHPKQWWYSILDSYLNSNCNKEFNLKPDTIKLKLQTLAINNIRVSSVEDLMKRLLILMHKPMGHIYRAKGFVSINGQWLKFDLVNNNYSIEPIAVAPESKIIVIGENLNKANLKCFFTVLDINSQSQIWE